MRRTTPTHVGLSDPEPPAPNLSTTLSSPGRVPGGFPAPARLARRPAPPTPRGARLPHLSGRSVRLSRPDPASCPLLLPPTTLLPAPSRVCPQSPALLPVLPTLLCPVHPSLLAAYVHVPPLPVVQPQASPAVLLRRRLLLSLPGAEAELRLPAGAARPALFPFSLPGKQRGERRGRDLAACWLSATNSEHGQ
uniref:Uncharacterized protein n=1 Tax=Molossus molossus TaxID=27622 RepID=A0A7J8FTJ2_MOLMO|nr:hypothetical protein HJG59_008356 [Molossus molossus]